jgi:poly(3-hydroxybutyrate) depolymerase
MQLFTMPSRSVGPNTSLVLFLHPYSGDSSWAASMFHLNHLVEQHDVIVLAPNGREVRSSPSSDAPTSQPLSLHAEGRQHLNVPDGLAGG